MPETKIGNTATCSCCGENDIPVDEIIDVQGSDYCVSCRDHDTFVCDGCDERHSDSECNSISDKDYCNSCYEDNTSTCQNIRRCNTRFLSEDAHTDYDGNEYCESCANDKLRSCGHCDETFHVDNMSHTYSDDYVCQQCLEEHYRLCADCNDYFRTRNMTNVRGTHYCEGCADDHMSSDNGNAISEYGYKPDPNFYGNDRGLYFGVEVELDKGDGDSSDASSLMHIMNEYRHSHIYIKEDGSISSGFEVVSHPATLDYHMNNMSWSDMFKSAVSMGYRSHKTETCGLHVHISRKFFGDGTYSQDVGIMKMLYLVERFWDNVLKFSRRSEERARQWADRYGLHSHEHGDPKALLDRAKNSDARYRAINLTNDETIEIRIFRGSLRYKTLIATLQFCHHLSILCTTLSLQEVLDLRWEDFVSKASGYAELNEYLELRGLANPSEISIDEESEV